MEVREARAEDAAVVLAFVRAKAQFDRELGAFTGDLSASEDLIRRHLFGPRPFAGAFGAGRGIRGQGHSGTFRIDVTCPRCPYTAFHPIPSPAYKKRMKSRLHSQNRRLPRALRPRFWEYDFARLSWQADRDLIIGWVLAAGDWDSVR